MAATEVGQSGSGPSFGIGIPCHNEAQNIERLLDGLCESWAAGGGPVRIVVVSDASTDGTDEIVRRVAARAAVPIVLEANRERHGKAAAVNRIIEALDDAEVIILVSADVLPVGDCLALLLDALRDPEVGVAAGRPVPEGPPGRPAVRVSRLLWELHHYIALERPKSTEITAFRNLRQRIDESSLVDEAEIEFNLTRAGYRIAYVPAALIRTMSPLSLRDYVRQRVRVTLGHLALARDKRYRVATLSITRRLAAIHQAWRAGRLPLRTLALAAALETTVYGAALALRLAGVPQDASWGRIDSAKRPVRRER